MVKPRTRLPETQFKILLRIKRVYKLVSQGSRTIHNKQIKVMTRATLWRKKKKRTVLKETIRGRTLWVIFSVNLRLPSKARACMPWMVRRLLQLNWRQLTLDTKYNNRYQTELEIPAWWIWIQQWDMQITKRRKRFSVTPPSTITWLNGTKSSILIVRMMRVLFIYLCKSLSQCN